MDRYPNGMSRSDLIYVGEIAEPLTGRLDWLLNERSKALDEIDQVNDYINELDDEMQRLEFGDE